ncbi:MAG: amidohydrolase [Bryobacteraceae bacterium]
MMRNAILLLLTAGAAMGGDAVLDRVSAHAERMGALSRQIWESPELGFHETHSSGLLQQEFRANGFTVEAGVAGMPTAFTATWGEGKPVIGILGEFDALPGLSQSDIPRQEAVRAGAPGHGCGHNLLGTAAALAAIAIKEELAARKLPGTIRYYGTPAEEGGGGKIYLLHAGLFNDVDAVLTWHPGDVNSVNLGSSLANNGGKFRFYGVAAHAAAAPERGRSALDGAMIMLNAVEMLREHVPEETRIHYIISNGGSAANVVPAFAEVTLIARSPDAGTLAAIWERIMKCAQAGALASETRFEFEQGTNYANILPNDTLSDVLGRAMRRAGGYDYSSEERRFAEEIGKTLGSAVHSPGPETVRVDRSEGHAPASTDVGDVSWVVPTSAFTAATFVAGVAPHTWQATACAGTSIGRKGMLVAARTLALGGMELFTDPGAVRGARDSFEKRRAGRSWTTHITAGSKPLLDYAVR